MPYVYRKLGCQDLRIWPHMLFLVTNWSIVPGRVVYIVGLLFKSFHMILNWFNVTLIYGTVYLLIYKGNLDGKLTIGNIYRPPRNDNSNACVDKILNELSPIVANLCRNNYNTVITGDMNLDLLKIDEGQKFQTYFDLFVTNSFFSTNHISHQNI